MYIYTYDRAPVVAEVTKMVVTQTDHIDQYTNLYNIILCIHKCFLTFCNT